MIKYVNKCCIFGILRVHRVPLCIWFLQAPQVLTLHFFKTCSDRAYLLYLSFPPRTDTNHAEGGRSIMEFRDNGRRTTHAHTHHPIRSSSRQRVCGSRLAEMRGNFIQMSCFPLIHWIVEWKSDKRLKLFQKSMIWSQVL